MPNWTCTLTNLNYLLAALFPLQADAIRLASTAGIPIMHVDLQTKAINNWHQILLEASRRDKVDGLIQASLRDYPEHPELLQALEGRLTAVQGPALGAELPWRVEHRADVFEKLTGRQSTLLPISFLEIGVQRARSVARLQLPDEMSGSGFLIEGNLLVTNHHVIPDPATAKESCAQFNYQKSSEGLDRTHSTFQFDPDQGFATSAADDWTVVRLFGDANSAWGAIPLELADIKPMDWVNIIQHPGGGPKQIALYHNLATYVDARRIQYLTDTLPGSSGSPVFDSRWRLAAVHHTGGWITEPGSKRQVFRNEGISVRCLLEGLTQSGLLG